MEVLSLDQTQALFDIYLAERESFPRIQGNKKHPDRYNKKRIYGLPGCLDGNAIAKMQLTKRQRLALKARSKLIEHNQGLIHEYAEKYISYSHMYDDLFSYGYFGLIKAVDTFDPTKGCVLSTHATWTIRQQLYHAVVNNLRLIKVDADSTEDIRAVTKAIEKCRKDHQPLTIKNICRVLTNEGLVAEEKIFDRVQRILMYSQEPLYFSMGTPDDEYTFEPPSIDDTSSAIPYEYTDQCKALIDSMCTRDAKSEENSELLCEYFGLIDGYCKNPVELLETYNKTPKELDDLINAAIGTFDAIASFQMYNQL